VTTNASPSRATRPQAAAIIAAAALASGATNIAFAQAGSKIAAPAGTKLTMKVPAIGVQIYKCAQTDGKFAWAFVAPEADLFDTNGKMIGKHGAGPFWELFDGSKVNGTVAQREDSTRPGAIPHLLLATRSTGRAGAIANVKHLQRINTIGGVAPASGCANAADIDKQARIYYTADYYLYE
jgi:hypothetical protein